MSKEWAAKYQRLGQQLADVPAVKSYATKTDDDGPEWRLAHALADIDEACAEYTPALQALLAATTPEDIADGLVDIVDVLRHMVYHLADPPYLRELVEYQLGEVKKEESVEGHS
jgi:hypothetical protein